MSILNVNKINPIGGGSTVTIAGIASVTNNISVGNSVTASSFHGNLNNSTLLLQTGGSERLRITSSGNVILKSGNLELGSTSGTDSIIHTTNAAGILYRADENGHRFQTYVGGWQDRLSIIDNGLVGIGTAAGSSSSTSLVVYEESGNAQTIEIKAKNTGGAGSQPGLRFTAPNNDNIGAVYGDVNSDSLIFATGTVERLKISPDGYITKPTNPVFNAFGGPNSINVNTDIVFGQERFDVGGGYNTSTGEYTAPITGYYHFYAQVYRVDTSNDSWWGFYLDNGSGYQQISEARLETDYGGDSGRGYCTLQSSIYWYMTAGHKIKCRVGAAGIIHCNNTLSYFCGNLVG